MLSPSSFTVEGGAWYDEFYSGWTASTSYYNLNFFSSHAMECKECRLWMCSLCNACPSCNHICQWIFLLGCVWRHKSCLTGLLNWFDNLIIISMFIWPCSITQWRSIPSRKIHQTSVSLPSSDSDVTHSTKFASLGNTKIPFLQVMPDVVNLWLFMTALYPLVWI